MRFTSAILALGLLVLVVALLRVEKRESRAAGAAVPTKTKQAAAPALAQAGQPAQAAVPGKAKPSGDPRYPSFEIGADAEWRESKQRAVDDAVAELHVDLTNYLRGQRLEWEPTEAYVRDLVLKHTTVQPQAFNSNDGEKHWKYKCAGTVEITPALRADLVYHDREFRARDRMGLLARVLAAAVAVLVAVTGSLRLDEATKGYYTGWLRVAALSFLGCAALALLLLA